MVEIYDKGQGRFSIEQEEQIMKFGYTIVYVPDVLASVEFFEKAFGLKRRFVHESGYGELETGATALAFATHDLGASNLPGGYVKASNSREPLGMEIALVTEDVAAAHAKAIAEGAVSIKEPMLKPWGQTVSYVRCPDGTLVEICSPLAT
jgi:catechol 2,3-dioxygenase-like lactoylglutathione lyase family enzyme